MGGIISKVHLGVPVQEDDGKIVIFAEAHAALVAFQPYAVHPSYNTKDLDCDGVADNDGKAVTAAPATLAVLHYVGIPQKAYKQGEVAKLVIGGACRAKLAAEAVVAGDYLEVLNAGITMIVDGTSGATARSTKSFAMACEPNSAAAGVFNIQMTGIPAIVSAS